MKKLLLAVTLLGLTSCVNQIDRLNTVKKLYPKCIIQPTTSLLARSGYDVMVEDTISNQIYVINFYPFSSNKIADIRNIK